MTGREHYREAEHDLRLANETSINDGTAAFYLASAQVHATLALAAAEAPVATVEYEYALMVDWGEGFTPRHEIVPATDKHHAAHMARTTYASKPARVVGREVQPWRYAHPLGTQLGEPVQP